MAVALANPPPEVRGAVRDSLVGAEGFESLPTADQREIANALVRIAHAAQLFEAEAAPRKGGAAVAAGMSAGEHYSGTAVAGVAGTTHAVLRAISFPRFVAELVNGIFRAMVDTNQQQLQQYIELVRGVSQSLDGFASTGGSSDDPAKRWLADQFPQSFRIEEPEAPDPRDIPDPEDTPDPVRLIPVGAPPTVDAVRAALNLEPDTAIPGTDAQQLIPFVRSSLARNRQQMLATMVQMGMQRIVIDSGRIAASMRFHIDAQSAAREQEHSGFDTRTTVGASASGGFGFWSASASVNSTIGYVRTDDVTTNESTNVSADLDSSVELHFRTDQVPLDRIASQNTVERLRLNTLNPEREAAIAAETDRARITANGAANPPTPAPTGGASSLAPSQTVTPPALAPITPRGTGTTGGGTSTPPPPASGTAPPPTSGSGTGSGSGTATGTATPPVTTGSGTAPAPVH
ncbi:hypothetical protein [Sphingomonas sp. NIBR02145]|uniref:hypothetical protein n=1 Tax=Sphingomonas sp. NIBR02145 TaxID=3014784 RepID=UPI0022B341DF|nr:hypothetical protein [Sphingomonas sp. NIBR02145]WHU01364.1 hypothetical protein O3305_14275 [Sphingomonas sp. NIBR02145]